jgi:hypothetical protein
LHVLLIGAIRPDLSIVLDGEEGLRLHHLWDGLGLLPGNYSR